MTRIIIAVRCDACGKNFTKKRKPTREHIWPRSQGGTNHDFNIKIFCEPCNQGKADILPPPSVAISIRDKALNVLESVRNKHTEVIALCRMVMKISEYLAGLKADNRKVKTYAIKARPQGFKYSGKWVYPSFTGRIEPIYRQEPTAEGFTLLNLKQQPIGDENSMIYDSREEAVLARNKDTEL